MYVSGDYNSRVGCKNDYISTQDCINIFEDENYIPDNHLRRASQDSKVNTFGNRLIDLCKSLGIRIVNGRLHSDHNIGRYTYVTSIVASVIDYLLTYDYNFSNIVDFKVDCINEWSDHTPIYFCNNVLPDAKIYTETKYCWDNYKKNVT